MSLRDELYGHTVALMMKDVPLTKEEIEKAKKLRMKRLKAETKQHFGNKIIFKTEIV
jgi:hypothetical protein